MEGEKEKRRKDQFKEEVNRYERGHTQRGEFVLGQRGRKSGLVRN